MAKTWGQVKSSYIRRKEAHETMEMETAARRDIERMRAKISDAEFWACIEAEAPGLDEVFPKVYEDIPEEELLAAFGPGR